MQRVELPAKEVDKVVVNDCGVRLKFYGLIIELVIEVGPMVLFLLIRNIDAVEVSQHALVCVEASVDVESVFMDNGCMI